MLYEFTIENYQSFGKAQTLSLMRGKERNKPENLFRPVAGFPDVVRSAAIFGHNASGKSNFWRAFQNFIQIIQYSAIGAIGFAPQGRIPGIEPNLLTASGLQEPTRFEIVFAMEGHVYRYGFSATPERIVAESLVEELKSGGVDKIFTRTIADAGGKTEIAFPRELGRTGEGAIRELTRKNALVVSSGANLNVDLLGKIHNHLTKQLKLISFGPFGNGFRDFALRLHEDGDFRQRIGQLASDADFGICGLRTQMPPEPTAQDIDRFRQTLRSQFGDTVAEASVANLNSGRRPAVYALHRGASGNSVEFKLSDESQGTQLFLQLAALLLDVARQGAVAVIDEFSANIHPLLANKLVEFFQNPENNTGSGQLIFTSHQSELLSSELFRKDQIWFAEKTRSGQTDLFSLASFRGEKSARSSEAFAKNYLAGRYGGVGDFGPLFSGVPLHLKAHGNSTRLPG